MALAQRDTSRHTYAEYYRWSDDQRYELIDGIAYLMAPAPTVDHQTVAFEIARQVANALEGSPCRVMVARVDVRLPAPGVSDDDSDTVVQPDVMVVCDAAKIDSRGVRGAPDWIVELISRSTAGHDQVVKRRVYERAGVREYWLVHPTDRVVTIHRLESGRYGVPDVCVMQGESPVGVLPGVVVRWEPIVARLLPQEA